MMRLFQLNERKSLLENTEMDETEIVNSYFSPAENALAVVKVFRVRGLLVKRNLDSILTTSI